MSRVEHRLAPSPVLGIALLLAAFLVSSANAQLASLPLFERRITDKFQFSEPDGAALPLEVVAPSLVSLATGPLLMAFALPPTLHLQIMERAPINNASSPSDWRVVHHSIPVPAEYASVPPSDWNATATPALRMSPYTTAVTVGQSGTAVFVSYNHSLVMVSRPEFGTQWNTTLVAPAVDDVTPHCAVVLPGLPQTVLVTAPLLAGFVAMWRVELPESSFTPAADPILWYSTPFTDDRHTNAKCSVAGVVNGRPSVAFLAGNSTSSQGLGIFVAVATNSAGSSWSVPSRLSFEVVEGDIHLVCRSLQIVQFGGLPAVATPTRYGLQVVFAQDMEATSWRNVTQLTTFSMPLLFSWMLPYDEPSTGHAATAIVFSSDSGEVWASSTIDGATWEAQAPGFLTTKDVLVESLGMPSSGHPISVISSSSDTYSSISPWSSSAGNLPVPYGTMAYAYSLPDTREIVFSWACSYHCPSPTPSPTPSPSPTSSATGTATPSYLYTLSNTPTATHSATPSRTPSQTPSPTASPVSPSPSPSNIPLYADAGFAWKTSAWTDCSKECGGGRRYRTVSCVDIDGKAAPDSRRCGLPVPGAEEACNPDPCPSLRWGIPGRWGSCSLPCVDSRTGAVGVTTRDPAPCLLHGLPTDRSSCTSSPNLVEPSTSRQCNLSPCRSSLYVWIAGAWGSCIPSNEQFCGPGTRSRGVVCADADGNAATDSLCDESTRPASIANCDSGVQCPCETDQDCKDSAPLDSLMQSRVTCDKASGSCKCRTGWAGTFCDAAVLLATSDVSCPTGIIDTDGACCETVVDASTGKCCQSGVADADGNCCNVGARLDACGVCNGTGVAVDANGKCCHTALSPGYECCPADSLDSCGVCGGTNECQASLSIGVDATQAQLDAALTPAAVDDLRAKVAVAFGLPTALITGVMSGDASSPSRILQTTTPPPSTLLTFMLAPGSGVADAEVSIVPLVDQVNSSLSIVPIGATSIERVPVCGNDKCEVGENCEDEVCASGCQADCPIISRDCPLGTDSETCSGHGSCMLASGVCDCHAGYLGAACDDCEAGFLMIGSSCVFLPGALTACTDGVRNGNEEDIDCGGPQCSPCPEPVDSSFMLLAGGAIGFVLLVVVLLAYRLTRTKDSDKDDWNSVAPSKARHGPGVSKLAGKGAGGRGPLAKGPTSVVPGSRPMSMELRSPAHARGTHADSRAERARAMAAHQRGHGKDRNTGMRRDQSDAQYGQHGHGRMPGKPQSGHPAGRLSQSPPSRRRAEDADYPYDHDRNHYDRGTDRDPHHASVGGRHQNRPHARSHEPAGRDEYHEEQYDRRSRPAMPTSRGYEDYPPDDAGYGQSGLDDRGRRGIDYSGGGGHRRSGSTSAGYGDEYDEDRGSPPRRGFAATRRAREHSGSRQQQVAPAAGSQGAWRGDEGMVVDGAGRRRSAAASVSSEEPPRRVSAGRVAGRSIQLDRDAYGDPADSFGGSVGYSEHPGGGRDGRRSSDSGARWL